MNVLKYLTFFLLMSFLIFPIFQVKGQSSGFKVMLDQYNWTSEMKSLKITNQEIGLILRITIWNNESNSIDYSLVANQILWINVRVDSTTDSGVYFFKQLSIDNLYLPPNETLTRFVNVEFTYGQPIGIYTAKCTYSFGTYPSTGQQVEGSPFDYGIVDNDTFNQQISQEIQRNKKVNVTWFSLTINFSLFTLGDLLTFIGLPSISIAVVSVSAYTYKRRKGKIPKENNSKKSNKQRTKTSPKR
jgi:hypothetical protein